MKKTTVLTILLAVLACSKGTNEQDVSFDSYEIKEPEIKGAIVDYRNMIVSDCKKEIQQGDSLYVGVTVKYINDSITRYVIYPIHHYESLRYVAPFFICNVDGHVGFINIIGGHSSNYTVNSALEMREQNFRQLIKRYFPKYLDIYKGKKKSKNRWIYEPENCYLTFLKGKLVDKTYECGTAVNTIPIVINGDTIWY